MTYKTFVLILVLFAQAITAFTQISSNMMKYWFYRNRLKYFVVVGDKYGESQIICVRNRIFADNDHYPGDHSVHLASKNADYGQHGKYQGLYISMLATEYYLLNKNYQEYDALNTQDELYKALKAVQIYWDQKAEDFWPVIHYHNSNYTNHWNGFFIRGNVPCDFYDPNSSNGVTGAGDTHLGLLNTDLLPDHTFKGNVDGTDIFRFGNAVDGYLPRGHPGYIDHRTASLCAGGSNMVGTPPLHVDENAEHFAEHPHDWHPESMSQDDAIWLLLGCELTIKLNPGGTVAQLASDIKFKIADYLLNIHHIFGDAPNRLFEPDGFKLREWEGGNTYSFGRPLAVLDQNPQFSDIPQWLVWAVLSIIPIKDYDLVGCLAAMTNSWKRTGAGLINTTSKNHAETFYILLWEVLHHTCLAGPAQIQKLEKALDQLDKAPCNGPYCYKSDLVKDDFVGGGYYSGSGWGSTYRWCKTLNEQYFGDSYRGNYNGLDYMLLYNLYHIVNYMQCPYYVNYLDKKLAHYLPIKGTTGATIGSESAPIKYTVFNTIISTQVIGTQTFPVVTNDPGNVTYVAGKHIKLEPGFHAREGCYFHAYIDKIQCEEGSSKNQPNYDYPDNMYTPYSDSIISAPKTPFPLVPEDTTNTVNYYLMDCPIDTIHFLSLNGDTSDSNYSYFWDFGNGYTSNSVNPSVYYTPGIYNLTLVLTDTNNNIDTINALIKVPFCNSKTMGIQDKSNNQISQNDPRISSWPRIEEDKWQTTNLNKFNCQVLPNPSNGTIFLISNERIESNSLFLITDLAGRQFFRKEINDGTYSIELFIPDIRNGIYLYSIYSADGKLLTKDKLVIIK